MDCGIAVESMTGDGYYPVPGFLAAPLSPSFYSRPNPSSEAPPSLQSLDIQHHHAQTGQNYSRFTARKHTYLLELDRRDLGTHANVASRLRKEASRTSSATKDCAGSSRFCGRGRGKHDEK